MFDEIKEVFLRTHSIDETVEETGINEYKVRRALITLGLWESRRSSEIVALKDQGLTTEEIADKLCLSVKGVESYLPYTRGAYLETITQNSIDSKNYRERMRIAAERQVAINRKLQEEGEAKVDFKDLEGMKVYKVLLELDTEDADMETLIKYGKVKEGITRTILVPSTMQLNRLNYAIQKCFGWENSHLHHFVLPDETFEEMTKGGDLEEWKKLAGVYFRCYDTMDDDNDLYYFDNYSGRGSFKSWLKKRYSEPILYNPESEKKEVVQKMTAYVELDDEKLPAEFFDEVEKGTKLDELKEALMEFGGEELLERLEIKDVFELDDEFIYEYDYGDGWLVRIKLLEKYENRYKSPESPYEGFIVPILDENRMEDSDPNVEGELREPVREVMATLKPICLEADGFNAFDDVGGINGFCEFLKGIHGEENDFDYEYDSREWAKDLGWSPKMPKPENIL